MTIKLSLLTVTFLISSINCQFSFDMPKPDMSFGDHNDRFDISSMMRKQNRMFRDHRDHHRRQSRRDNDEDEDEMLKLLEAAFNTIESRLITGGRRNDENRDANFAYHDEMYSKEGGGVTDFEINLKKFQRSRPSEDDYRRSQKYIDRLHGGPSRKVGNPEKEILMHYAVPVDFKVKGFLQAPLVK